jgi:hypothetical protein
MTRAAARRPRRPLFSILDLWARPISFLPILGRIPGSDAVAALWMSHALERQRQAGEGKTWICPSWEWYDATLLGRKEQERARRFWAGLGIVADLRAGGVAAPGNALAYVVNVRALDALVRSHLEEGPSPAPGGVPKRPKRTLPKRPKRTLPEMSQTDTSSIIPVVLPTEETGKESERGVQGGSNAPDERNERDQQQAAGTAARARSSEPGGGPCSSSSQPSPEEWADHCRTTWPNWNADDIARAYHSAAAAGWRKSRGGRIRDWRAFSVVCAKVWEASREGQEAARRAKEREKEQERRAESLRRLEAARTPASSLTPEEREANRAALLQGLFGKRAA